MASESFIHALLLCLGLFLKISHWAPLSSENQNEIDGVVSRSKQLSGRQSHVSTLCDSKFLCFCLLLRQPCFYLIVNHDVVSRIRKLFSPDRKFYASWLHCKTPVTVFWSQTTDVDYSRLVTRVWPSSLSNKSAILISCLDASSLVLVSCYRFKAVFVISLLRHVKFWR